MVAAGGLIICVIVLDEPRGIVRKRVHHAAGTFISTCTIVFRTLDRPGLALSVTGGFIVGAAEITLARHAGHIIHGGSDGCLDTGIKRRRVDGHSAKTANADDTNSLRINHFVG